jgi:hypothetical protein
MFGRFSFLNDWLYTHLFLTFLAADLAYPSSPLQQLVRRLLGFELANSFGRAFPETLGYGIFG